MKVTSPEVDVMQVDAFHEASSHDEEDEESVPAACLRPRKDDKSSTM